VTNAQRKVVLTFIILVVAVLLVRPYLQKSAAGSNEPVAVILQEAFENSKPLALIFTYDADCCPDTEEFFKDWAQQVSMLLAQYIQINAVWLNVGSESPDDQQAIMKIARDYEVTHIPTLLLLDWEKQKVDLFVGEFDRDEVLTAMERAVSQ
jgi:hypothetical protein